MKLADLLDGFYYSRLFCRILFAVDLGVRLLERRCDSFLAISESYINSLFTVAKNMFVKENNIVILKFNF